MSKSSKIILGILTFLPVLAFIAYFISIFSIFTKVASMPTEDIGPAMPSGMVTAMIWVGIAMLLTFGLWIYYIIHIAKNPKFKQPEQSNSKVIWILVVIFGSVMGMIVYFFVEVWPEKKEESLLQ